MTRFGKDVAVPGALVIVFVLVVVIPVGFLVTMSGMAALLGGVLKKDVDEEYEGTEYLELGR